MRPRQFEIKIVHYESDHMYPRTKDKWTIEYKDYLNSITVKAIGSANEIEGFLVKHFQEIAKRITRE